MSETSLPPGFDRSVIEELEKKRAEEAAETERLLAKWGSCLDAAELHDVLQTTEEDTLKRRAMRKKTAAVLESQQEFFGGKWDDRTISRHARALGLTEDAAGDIRLYLTDTFGDRIEAIIYAGIAKMFPKLASHELFSVQPLRKRDDNLFYFEAEYTPAEKDGLSVPEVRVRPSKRVAPIRLRSLKSYFKGLGEAKIEEYWKIDPVETLFGVSFDELGKEVDRENVSTAMNAAITSGHIFSVGGRDWEDVAITLAIASNKVHKDSMRGPATYLLTSPEIAAFIEAYAKDAYKPVKNGTMYPTGGITEVATLMGKWRVFIDPYFPRNRVLLGRRGHSELDTPLVWGPFCFPVFPIKRDNKHGAGFATYDSVALVAPGQFAVVEFLQI